MFRIYIATILRQTQSDQLIFNPYVWWLIMINLHSAHHSPLNDEQILVSMSATVTHTSLIFIV